MKKIFLCCLTLLGLLAACTPYQYGIPQDSWDRMSERERIEAIRAYERQEAARQQAAEERERREAIQRERERVRKAEEERMRHERIESIHRGEGAYGELIRVRLQGGRMKIGDRHHRYQPLTFTIAEGETRELGVADRKGRESDLTATYTKGALTIDGIRFPYERSWGKGTLYTDTGTSGPRKLRGVDVFVEIVSRSGRHDRESGCIVIVHEEEYPAPRPDREERRPPVVVFEKPRPQEQPRQPRVEMQHRGELPEKRAERPQEQPRQPKVETQHRGELPRGEKPPVIAGPPRMVEVAFLAGEAKVRGRKTALKQQAVTLREGETREVTLTEEEERSVTVAYRDGEITIDSNRGKGRSEVGIKFEKDWGTGKLYRFSFKGKGALEKVEVRVTAK